jgi:predicted dinucleotide-binding enzyme
LARVYIGVIPFRISLSKSIVHHKSIKIRGIAQSDAISKFHNFLNQKYSVYKASDKLPTVALHVKILLEDKGKVDVLVHTNDTVDILASPRANVTAFDGLVEYVELIGKMSVEPSAAGERRPRQTKVGILGSGEVAQALGLGFAGRGYKVMLGSRTPESAKLVAWAKKAGTKATTGSFAEAAEYGDILLIATLGTATEEVLDLAGVEKFEGKLVIDVTNPLDFSKGMPPGLFVGVTDSLGERIQRKMPNAKVVKCFNTVPNSQMVHPNYEKAEMLICGYDVVAKRKVTGILKEFGWEGSIDCGGIDSARWLEALVPLWARVGTALDVWSHAFIVDRGLPSASR